MVIDPEMRKYDGDELRKCPACPGYMVPLQGFEITTASEGPVMESDFEEFMLWGWWAYVYNFLFGAMQFNERKRKVARLKNEILPQFPASQICSQCLHVRKRR